MKNYLILFILLFQLTLALGSNVSLNSTGNSTAPLTLNATSYLSNASDFNQSAYLLMLSIENGTTATYGNLTAQTYDYASEPFEVHLNFSNVSCQYGLIDANVTVKYPIFMIAGGAGSCVGNTCGTIPKAADLCIRDAQPAVIKSVWVGYFDSTHCPPWNGYGGLPCAQCIGLRDLFSQYEINATPALRYSAQITLTNSKNESISANFSDNDSGINIENKTILNWSSAFLAPQFCPISPSDLVVLKRTDDRSLFIKNRTTVTVYSAQVDAFGTLSAELPYSTLLGMQQTLHTLIFSSSSNSILYIANSTLLANLTSQLSYPILQLLISSDFLGKIAVKHAPPVQTPATVPISYASGGGGTNGPMPTPVKPAPILNITILSPQNNTLLNEAYIDFIAEIKNNTEAICLLSVDQKPSDVYFENGTVVHSFSVNAGEHTAVLSCSEGNLTNESVVYFKTPENKISENAKIELPAPEKTAITAEASSNGDLYAGALVVSAAIVVISIHRVRAKARTRKENSNPLR